MVAVHEHSSDVRAMQVPTGHLERPAHQLPRDGLPHIHEIINEAIFLPVYTVDLPRELGFSLALVLLVYSLLHLLLKIFYGFLDLIPAFRSFLAFQSTTNARHD